MHRRSLLKNLALLSGGLSLSKTLQAASAEQSVRLVHLTDTHIMPHIGAARGFEKCLHHLQNQEQKPHLIINGGDAIMGLHGAQEKSIGNQWELFHSVLKSENQLPIYHCLGNHDIFKKNNGLQDFENGKKQALDNLGLADAYQEVDIQNWKILILDSIQHDVSAKAYQGKISDKQLHWLKNRLESSRAAGKFVLIVSHIPILSACVYLDGKNFKNGEWRIPGTWMHSDTESLIELFDQFPEIKLAISGHIHLNDRIDYNSVSYFCNGAVSGNWWMGNYKKTAPGYANIELKPDGSFTNTYQPYF